MRVPQPDIIEHFGNADAVPQPPKRCLSRKAGIVRCCLSLLRIGKYVMEHEADLWRLPAWPAGPAGAAVYPLALKNTPAFVLAA